MAEGNLVKCSRCAYRGPQSSFPRRALDHYLKTCNSCTAKNNNAAKKRRRQQNDNDDDDDSASESESKRRRLLGKDVGIEGPPTLQWSQIAHLLKDNADHEFELHAYAQLDDPNIYLNRSGAELARHIAKLVWDLTGYRFIYKKKASSGEKDTVYVYTYYCAQLDGEQSKKRLNEDESKRRARMCMERLKCSGWLHITIDSEIWSEIIVCISHYLSHTPYTSISMPDEVARLIESLKDLTPTKIWDAILSKFEGKLNITQKQVYAHWSRLNQNRWRFDDDQVASTRKVLESFEGIVVDIIVIPEEPGISVIAFAFKEILTEYGAKIQEIAMDSTWKTKAVGYELLSGLAYGRAGLKLVCWTPRRSRDDLDILGLASK
ncbi:hypothetical protein H0H93_004744 [Arthromyces matolae]|nr:hypothetical protein H0H93_004744 [Arthromyces matolae]